MKNHIRLSLVTICISIACKSMASNVYSLYTDHRALKIDDIVTVLVVESAKAGSQSGTSTAKSNDVNVQANKGSGLLGFLPSFGASAGTKADYDGKGSTSRTGSLEAKISARVTKVLENGNLMIEGSKVVEINNEKEQIQISGIVRPQDIDASNNVYSYAISDAKITYSGKGSANTGQRPGLLARFINWLL